MIGDGGGKILWSALPRSLRIKEDEQVCYGHLVHKNRGIRGVWRI